MYKLVIVESPAKAKTIKGFLGSGYKVEASVGHVRDLPKTSLGIDVDDNFTPHYINIRGKGDTIKNLKKLASGAGKVFLATDPDREGEAISWHLANALDLDINEENRVTFNEITKSTVCEAIKHPRKIDMNLVDAQQARRILDRIVGYKVSPFLWKSVRSGLSAGRVQSVAVRIIVDREKEIRAFVPKEYYTVEADLLNSEDRSFTAHYYGSSKTGKKVALNDVSAAEKVVSDAKNGEFVITKITRGSKPKTPYPPFTTSTLQQEASRKLGYAAQRTMKIAQELYSGINLGAQFGGSHGLITYMRTDSTRISSEAAAAAKEYILAKFGTDYYPSKPRVFSTKAGAQDAHEAIRPTAVSNTPEAIKDKLTAEQFRLYKLIYDRFIASQMASAVFDTLQADIVNGDSLFRSSGSSVKFDGYLALYDESKDTESDEDGDKIPSLSEGEKPKCESILPTQHFTEPPSRYTEASLIKLLEENGIGRPSTYAQIMSIITGRDYIKKIGKTLAPTAIGEVVTEVMCRQFEDIMDKKFTASMESRLDSIQEGGTTLLDVMNSFYGDFTKELEKANESLKNGKVEIPVEETDIICEKCGAKMVVKSGKFGKFAACPNYPKCKNTKPLNPPKKAPEKAVPSEEHEKKVCDKCGADMVVRSGRYGSFYACSNYPKCRNTMQITKDIGVKCPKCGGDIVQRNGKNRSVFFGCSNYPECDFSSWDTPTDRKCPKCGDMMMKKKGKNASLVCRNEACGYKEDSAE